jgi:uncharacterized protein (DUF1501 family)
MSRRLISRRACLQTSAAAGLAFWTFPGCESLFAQAAESRRAKSCILIFLEGGPSQLDTFDPKPGTPEGGPIEAISTSLTGVSFSSYLPKLAAMADRLAVVRTLNSMEGDHDRAQNLLYTGYSPNPRLDYPALGASVARYADEVSSDMPAFVAIGSTKGGGILGPQFSPFVIDDVNNPAPSLTLPDGFRESRMKRRLEALQKFNSNFSERHQSPLGTDLSQLTRRVDSMRAHQVFQPFDPASAEPELYERYGGNVNDGSLARACLQARRFVEAGVRFVTIQFGGWDTHTDNFNQVQTLCASLDAAMATLIDDLSQRGLLETTLVTCVGEFGRTPVINGGTGRDHFPNAFAAMLAGGGVKTGQVLGATTDNGTEIKDRPVTVPDYHATLFSALGLDVRKDYFAPDGRLIKLTNGGTPLLELLPS